MSPAIIGYSWLVALPHCAPSRHASTLRSRVLDSRAPTRSDSSVDERSDSRSEPETRRHYGPLDGLRGIAIFLVMCVHAFAYDGSSRLGALIDSFARAGWVGVTLFFVLSGFLITGILIDTRGTSHYYRDFYVRRSLRVFPLYFAFLAIYLFVVPHVLWLSRSLPQPDAREQLLDWFYLANMRELFAQARVVSHPLDPLWSLSVEEQVYLFWPLMLAFIPARLRGSSFVVIAVASLLWRVVSLLGHQSYGLVYCLAPSNLEAFAAGGLIAHLARTRPALLKTVSLPLLFASSAFVGGMFVGLRHFAFWKSPAEVLSIGNSGAVWLFAALIALSLEASPSSFLYRALSLPALRLFGKHSYAIYLVHMPALAILRSFACPSGGCSNSFLGAVLLFTSTVACSLLIALLSWYLWEMHFLKLKAFFPTSGLDVRAKIAVARPSPAE